MKNFELQKFSDDLDGIIHDFGSEGKIFSNEAQFQLELAWALKEKGYTIRLEVLSCSKQEREEAANESNAEERKRKIEKMYTDIVVDFPNDESIAIELKYKIEADNDEKQLVYDVNGHKNIVFHQGAANIGCFQYLEDVVRLERLVNGDIPFDLYNNGLEGNGKKKVVCGYAIILTNGSTYWDEHEDGTELKVFGLEQDKPLAIDLSNKRQTKKIKLSNKYICHWEAYYGIDKIKSKMTHRGRRKKGVVKDEVKWTPFGYLILQVPPKQN